MTQERFGIDHIGEQSQSSLFASDFPTKQVPVVAKEDLGRGSVVTWNDDGTVSMVETGDTVFGVLIRDRKAGETGMAWITGDFVGDQLKFGSGTWQEWAKVLRDNYAPLIFSEGATN